MVAPTDINTSDLRGRTFKGFVQFQIPDGSTWYRLKERQTMQFSMSWTRAVHYTDDGQKVVDPSGHNHQFRMSIKVTSDMFDDHVWTSTNGVVDENQDASFDKKTLSYWMYKNEIHEPIEVIFVTTMEMLTGPAGDTLDDTVNLKFRLDPANFTTGLSSSDGSPSIEISGTVLSIQNALRAVDGDQS